MAHLKHDLLPRTSHEPPGALAFVGYSDGAYLMTYLALASAVTRGLAVLGSSAGAIAAATDSFLDAFRFVLGRLT